MNSIQIETFAVNAVKDSILMSDYLTPFINENDKEPSWDGAVYIYKDRNCTKDNLKGRMPVQVKGKESDDLSKNEISYTMTVIDLKNYLDDGGAILFVVYIGNGGLSKKIYYIELPPIKLRIELGSVNGQKTKTLKLKEFPVDNNKKASIFLNCYENCRRQSSFSSATLLTLDELQEQGVLEGITVPISTIGMENPKLALLSSEVYIYAKIKGSSIPQPLEIIPKDIHTREIEVADISIGDKQFYSSLCRIRTAEQSKYIFGESFSIIFHENGASCKIKYKNSDNIRVLAKDLDFMITCIEEGYFSLNGTKMKFDYNNEGLEKFDMDQQKNNLKNAKDIVRLLDILGCDKDINIGKLSKGDWINLDRLIYGLIYKKPIKVKLENLAPVQLFNVGELKFAICLTPDKNVADTFYLSDFFKTEMPACIELESGETVFISQYFILKKKELNCLDNIRYEVLLPSFQKLQRHHETINRANYFFLELLLAYDESKNRRLLEAAKEFADWLCESNEEELPYSVKELNRLQVIKRIRDFNIEEVKDAYSIIEDPTSTDIIRAGAYLLLDQQSLAAIHFDRLDETLKNEFKTYPIYYFWKAEEKENE